MRLEVLQYIPETNLKENHLLFVHGGNHGAWCWREHFLPYFSINGFPSYALSLRGHGKSDGYDKLNSFFLNDYMEDVLEVIQSLKIKPVLIGHSMGGAIAQKILYFYPDKIRAVVLMASVPPDGLSLKDLFPTIYSYYRVTLLSILRKSSYENNRVKHAKNMFLSKRLQEKESSDLVLQIQQESSKATKELFKQIVPRYTDVPLPILVLGSGKDPVISVRATTKTGKSYKTQYIIYPNMCHDMMLDPDWRTVADEIIAFVNNL